MSESDHTHILTKSQIISGLQCSKAVYLSTHLPDITIVQKPWQETLHRSGIEAIRLARDLYPGGFEIEEKDLSTTERAKATDEAIKDGNKIIYNAVFESDGISIHCDIILKSEDTWKVFDVKTSTNVKATHYDDATLQYVILRRCGLDIGGVSIVHVNSSYVRHGKIDAKKVFSVVDVTEECIEKQSWFENQIERIREIIANGPVEVDIGPHCTNPRQCMYIPYCWKHIPENSVFDLKGEGINPFEYYENGILRIEDLQLEELNERQRLQVLATLQKSNYLNLYGLKRFLSQIWYPISFLDFETFSAPIPRYDGIRPYQNVPFQYSLHVQRNKDSEPEHYEFLAPYGSDPRNLLIEHLLSVLPDETCIIVYNHSFERSILSALAGNFPEYSREISSHIKNLVDLMDPFQYKHVYSWRMKGSYSIKYILPALVPDLSYSDLEISNGAEAMHSYLELEYEKDPAKIETIRKNLLNYCFLDTYAMYRILEKLEDIAITGSIERED